jgi:hypothetical protein
MDKVYAEDIDKEDVVPPASEDMLPLWELHKDVKFIAGLYVPVTLDIFRKTFT